MAPSPPIPAVEPRDSENVRSALLAAQKLWDRGEKLQAAQQLQRAAEAAAAANAVHRGLVLARAATQLRADAGAARESTSTAKAAKKESLRPAARRSVRPSGRQSARPPAKQPQAALQPAPAPKAVESDIECEWDDADVAEIQDPFPSHAPAASLAKEATKPPPLPKATSAQGPPAPPKTAATPGPPPLPKTGDESRPPLLPRGAAEAKPAGPRPADKPTVDIRPQRAQTGGGQQEVARAPTRPPPDLSVADAVRVWVGPSGQIEIYTTADRAPTGFVEAIIVAVEPRAGLAERLRQR